MKLIAHRGLTQGPNKELENKPEQIISALDQGYDCEIDLWTVNSDFYLGHDAPTYSIHPDFLKTYGLWIHAKNLAALRWLTTTQLTYFWHQNDDCTLTSNNFIWTYPEKELTQRSIRLMPEWADPDFITIPSTKCYAICSDYVDKIKDIISSDQSQQ